MNLERIKEITAYSYIGFDFFCAAIMVIMFYAIFNDADRTKKRIHLLNVTVAVFTYCFADMLWFLAFNGVMIPRTVFTRYATNIFSYSIMYFCSYAVSRFLISIWESVRIDFHPKSWMFFIPYLFLLLLILTTPWTHIIFSFDTDGNIVQGPLYLVVMGLLFGYVLFLGLVSFVFYLRTQNDFAKEQYFLVTLYTIPVLIGGFVHFIHWELPTFVIGLSIATLIIYIFQMRDMISQDALTGIMNRRQGERFFVEQISRINEEPHSTIDCLYLFMMDLNKFKAINDTYGHTEGDRALIATADVLKKACSHIRRRCVMSRFGGDEFVIGVVFTPEEAHFLYEKIHNLIEEKNRELNAPYKISISIGFTYYKKEFKDFTSFLAHADKLMYEMKEKAHREAEKSH
ncbi:MAG: GGDEF domain-containing protein [Treponema sp.]|nr:GGDEF domain-containing protein [Treponema sp.]